MDKLIKGMGKDFRFFGADLIETVQTAKDIHNLNRAETICFGKFLCTCLMMSSDLKSDSDLITLRCDVADSEEFLTVTANNKGEVKGYPAIKIENSDNNIRNTLIDKFRNGTLTLIKDTGLKMPYNSTVKMITGEIARDFTYYFHNSEQTPSVVGLDVTLDSDNSVKKAYGFIVQLLPGAPEEIVASLEKNMSQLPHLGDLSDMGFSLDWILSTFVLKDIPYEITLTTAAKYYCDCNKDRFERGLILLGKDELNAIINEKKDIAVKCHTCNKEYLFTINELQEMIKISK